MPNDTYTTGADTERTADRVARGAESSRTSTTTDRAALSEQERNDHPLPPSGYAVDSDGAATPSRPRPGVREWLGRDIPRSRAAMAVGLALICLPLVFLWFVSVLQLTGIGFIGIICAAAFLSIGRLDSIDAGRTPWRRPVPRGLAIAAVAVYLGSVLFATVVVGTPIAALEPVVVVLVPALVAGAAGYAVWAAVGAVRERASARSGSR